MLLVFDGIEGRTDAGSMRSTSAEGAVRAIVSSLRMVERQQLRGFRA
jgi:hypothetical protein